MPNVRYPVLLGARARGRGLAPDGFHVHEFAEPPWPELASIPGMLDAAEREARVGRDHPVDEHRAGFEIPDEAIGLRAIPSPGRRREAERRVVRDANGVIEITGAKHRRHRTE